MLLTFFFTDGATAQVTLPEECVLYEPEIKQYLRQLLGGYTKEVQKQILRTFNTGPWEIVDDNGNILMKKSIKESDTKSTFTKDLIQKIEELEKLQSAAKDLSSIINTEEQEINRKLKALQDNEQLLLSNYEQQREISKELVELQKLLNELLTIPE